MSITKTTNLYNRNRPNWENYDVPILCHTCLGDNPYLRMLRHPYGNECKICDLPFTIFRWYVGHKMRFKKTEICQSCSKMRNVCQTCILDLEYGLPTKVRDMVFEQKSSLSKNAVNKEYLERGKSFATEEYPHSQNQLNQFGASNSILNDLARRTPHYRRNQPHVCSFWIKGKCKRGEECPYRHELPDQNQPLSYQNIKDRFYGVEDPVATKILSRAHSILKLKPPENKQITTLYIGNLIESINEGTIRDNFYQYGEIRLISIKLKDKCAFVQYTNRRNAELAANSTVNKLILCGQRVTIRWAYSQIKIPIYKHKHLSNNAPIDYLGLRACDMIILPQGYKFNQKSQFPPNYNPHFIYSLP